MAMTTLNFWAKFYKWITRIYYKLNPPSIFFITSNPNEFFTFLYFILNSVEEKSTSLCLI